jgi:carboxymethylenebutenolidase
MSEINKYLTEEVVLDYGDGLISRREAMRRLGLLGVGAAVAEPMLAACDAQRTPGNPATSDNPSASAAPAPATSGLPTEMTTFTTAQGRTLMAAWATAPSPKGSVLVIHENRGLTDHIRSVAGRFAASGYAALAVDLLSEEGGTAKFTDSAQATAALGAADPARFVADMKAAITELQRRVPAGKVGAIGFCFGGGQVWSLLASAEPRLYAAAPFYGPLPDGADFAGSPNAKVLAVYAELDQRVNATRDAAEAALTKAGLSHELTTFPGVDHAFFNDTGGRYNAEAASQAYQKVLDWFGRYLA